MAFQSGLSGLNNSSKALDVISNNIANASTVGFKGGQAQFSDVFAASIGAGGSASQVGIGSNMSGVAQQFSQGNISTSSNSLDIAINGSGFYRMQKSQTDQTITYTRNGQFKLDDKGYLVNAQGLNLTGYPITNGVVNRASLVPVQLDTSGVAPQATGASSVNPGIQTQINLDDRDLKSLTSASPNNLAAWSANTSFPPNDLNTYNYSTSVTVYDQRGNDHALSTYFTRVGNSDNTAPAKDLMQVHYVLDNKDITSSVVPATSGGSGVPTLEFKADGSIVTTGFTATSGIAATDTITVAATVPLSFTPATGTLTFTDLSGNALASPLTEGVDYTITASGALDFSAGIANNAALAGQGLKVSYTTATTAMGSDYKFNIDTASLAAANPEFAGLFPNNIPIDYTGSTLFGSGNDVNKQVQDGYAYGRLSGTSVSSGGVLRGNYSNGQTKDIAQICLVDFIAPTGLVNMGNNQWSESAASGAPLVGDPGTGNRGLLQASANEDANVDLTQELVNLITQQRNYQANAQSIKTQDQVMQTLVNLR